MIVLISGASGGLGAVLGATLVEKGMTVYGTMRKPQGREADYPFSMLAMEATNDESVQACIDKIVEEEGRVDVVINCINTMIIGSTEEESIDEVEQLYRTNVFGVLRVCKAIVPQLRKQGGGTIVNMSSLGGLIAVPYMGAYTSAKFALETLSEALYQEVKHEGIDIVIMQPVAMYMDRPATGNHLHTVNNVASDSFTHQIVKMMASDTEASKLTPQIVSDKIHEVITAEKKPLRVPMDKAKAVGILKRIAPQSLIDKLVGKLMSDAGKL